MAIRKPNEKLQTTFNPTKFNPEKYAAAKDAGMKYVDSATKNHDGFCMFDIRQPDPFTYGHRFGRGKFTAQYCTGTRW